MRYCGKIGYEINVEVADSIWEPRIIEKLVYGDVVRNTTRRDSSDRINDELTLNNRISIVADPFALSNFQSIKYVEWLNQRWNVKSVEVQMPRLIFEIGGAYTGQGPYVPQSGEEAENG